MCLRLLLRVQPVIWHTVISSQYANNVLQHSNESLIYQASVMSSVVNKHRYCQRHGERNSRVRVFKPLHCSCDRQNGQLHVIVLIQKPCPVSFSAASTVTAFPVAIRMVMLLFFLRRLNWLLEWHTNFLCLLAWNGRQGQSLPFVEDRAFLPSIHMSTLSG
jgi:hypothetical protein